MKKNGYSLKNYNHFKWYFFKDIIWFEIGI